MSSSSRCHRTKGGGGGSNVDGVSCHMTSSSSCANIHNIGSTNRETHHLSSSKCSGSMAGPEVVSEKSFQLRLEAMSAAVTTCADCLKERAKVAQHHNQTHHHHQHGSSGILSGSNKDASSSTGHHHSHHSQTVQRGRRRRRTVRIARLNSPIVVRLQDTIKVSVKNKWRNSPKSSDLESEDGCVSSDDNGPGTHNAGTTSSRGVKGSSSHQSSSGTSTASRHRHHHHLHHHHNHHHQVRKTYMSQVYSSSSKLQQAANTSTQQADNSNTSSTYSSSSSSPNSPSSSTSSSSFNSSAPPFSPSSLPCSIKAAPVPSTNKPSNLLSNPTSSTSTTHWPTSLAAMRDDKNFNAFLSAIERVHQKGEPLDKKSSSALQPALHKNLGEYIDDVPTGGVQDNAGKSGQDSSSSSNSGDGPTLILNNSVINNTNNNCQGSISSSCSSHSITGSDMSLILQPVHSNKEPSLLASPSSPSQQSNENSAGTTSSSLRHMLDLLPGSDNIDLIRNDLRSADSSGESRPSSVSGGTRSGSSSRSNSIVGGTTSSSSSCEEAEPSDVDLDVERSESVVSSSSSGCDGEEESVVESSEGLSTSCSRESLLYEEDEEGEEFVTHSEGSSSVESDHLRHHLQHQESPLCTEELDYLTQYTAGQGITRYDCAPNECPECIAYFAYAQYASANLHLEAASKAAARAAAQHNNATQHDEYEEEEDEEEGDVGESEYSSDSDSVDGAAHRPISEVTVTGKGKVTVSVANVFTHARLHHRKHRQRGGYGGHHSARTSAAHTAFPNAVYLDLTDTDIGLSIQYHPDHPPPSPSHRNEPHHHHHHHHHQSATHHSAHPHHHHHQQQQQLHQLTGDWGFTWQQQTAGHWGPPPGSATSAAAAAAAATTTAAATAGWAAAAAMPWLMPYYMMVAVPWMPDFYPFPWFNTNPKPIVVPRNLRCLNSQRLCMVPATEIKSFTASQPPQRPWIPLAHPERNRPVAIYTVMCYNVLCDKYATRQLYGYCPSWALNWEYRKKGIIEEIRHYSADVITLQEVEGEQFYNFFQPELKRDGYDGIFSPKSRARTMTEVDRKHVDGCAIFFRTSKFSLIKEHLIEFNQLAMASAEGSHEMLNRVMTKDNIGLAALLQCKDGIWENGLPGENSVHQSVLVATCHIHWDPEFCDVKLIQTMMLMNELKNIIEETQTSFRPGSSAPDCNTIPLLLCGDLNSLPDSGVVEYLMTGKVHANHLDFKDMGYDTCLKKLSNSDNKDIFAHGFKLAQAYNKSIMAYTNYTFDFKGILDYIFSSRDHMRPLGLLGPLEPEWFRENKVLGCPHPHIPSDHLPLLVEYEMQPSSVVNAANATASGGAPLQRPAAAGASGGSMSARR